MIRPRSQKELEEIRLAQARITQLIHEATIKSEAHRDKHWRGMWGDIEPLPPPLPEGLVEARIELEYLLDLLEAINPREGVEDPTTCQKDKEGKPIPGTGKDYEPTSFRKMIMAGIALINKKVDLFVKPPRVQHFMTAEKGDLYVMAESDEGKEGKSEEKDDSE